MRDLKRDFGYSIEEQEGMLPFERDLLVNLIMAEKLKDADRPAEGWTKYVQELGIDKKTGYNPNFRVLESPAGGPGRSPAGPSLPQKPSPSPGG